MHPGIQPLDSPAVHGKARASARAFCSRDVDSAVKPAGVVGISSRAAAISASLHPFGVGRIWAARHRRVNPRAAANRRARASQSPSAAYRGSKFIHKYVTNCQVLLNQLNTYVKLKLTYFCLNWRKFVDTVLTVYLPPLRLFRRPASTARRNLRTTHKGRDIWIIVMVSLMSLVTNATVCRCLRRCSPQPCC
jgi:hypothetical protein